MAEAETKNAKTVTDDGGNTTKNQASVSTRRYSVSWRTCFRIGITVLAIFLCVRYLEPVENFINLLLGGMLAIFAGFVITYIVNIPMRFFERKLPGPRGDGTTNRTISMLLAFACILGVLLVVLILVLPNLVGAVAMLSESIPAFVSNISGNPTFSSVIPADMLQQIESIDWVKVTNDIAAWAQAGVMESLPEVMSAVGKIGACFMGVIVSFWFLGEKDALSSGAHEVVATYLGKSVDDKVKVLGTYADGAFHGYIVGAALEGTIFGLLVVIGCTVADIPGAPILGALVGVMSLIPVIGALVGAVLGAIMIFAVSWQKALIFLVIFFIVQQIEQNFFYPRVVGKRAGLTGLWPLIGTTLGMAVFGFPGALVGVPLIATILRIVDADLQKRKESDDEGSSLAGKLQKSLDE